MNERNGFTLVEIMVVVAVFMFMMTFGIPAYSSWKQKHDVETEIRQIYNYLQVARMKAYSEKVVWGMWWGGGNFSTYQVRKDGNNNGDINDALGTDLLQYSVTAKYLVTPTGADSRIDFDSRGFCSYPAEASLPACLRISSSTGAASDCVLVYKTKLKLGKWDAANAVCR